MAGMTVYALIVAAALFLGSALALRRDLNGERLFGVLTAAIALASVGMVVVWFNRACWETWQPCGPGIGTAIMASVALSAAGAIVCAITLARH
jgi:uncharacterized membrane protein